MNNKGFTLIELLSVILILGIISSIAVVSFSKITDDIKNTQQNNIIETLKIDASNYAFENGSSNITYISVDDLIQSGYTKADDESDYIYDIKDNTKKINCTIFKVEYVNGNYNVVLENDELISVDINENCDYEYNDLEDISIYCNNEKCENVVENTTELNLKINNSKIKTELENATDIKIKWQSDNGFYRNFNNFEEGETLDLTTLNNINTNYSVILEYTINSDSYQYIASASVIKK